MADKLDSNYPRSEPVGKKRSSRYSDPFGCAVLPVGLLMLAFAFVALVGEHPVRRPNGAEGMDYALPPWICFILLGAGLILTVGGFASVLRALLKIVGYAIQRLAKKLRP